ncbi:hypothetical protein BGZ96_003607 [Linnemannia gamsii]|uniref:Uncharacterized protein n=1 Tax=Linnemannia gamsii TaxID=64522 RepID=A0ABQ7K8J1_9FUNG|nr:hypothetical protein BGZ96_003607 [Linnemannia gamsii]
MSISNSVDPQTPLMGHIQDMMLNLNALRIQQDADLAALCEVIPTTTTTSCSADSTQIFEKKAMPGTQSEGSSVMKKYITQGMEDERSRLLKTRLMLYNQAHAFYQQIALLSNEFEEVKKMSNAMLLSDMQFLLCDLWEEERVLTETLEDGTISKRNRFLLMFYRRMLFMVAESITKSC